MSDKGKKPIIGGVISHEEWLRRAGEARKSRFAIMKVSPYTYSIVRIVANIGEMTYQINTDVTSLKVKDWLSADVYEDYSRLEYAEALEALVRLRNELETTDADVHEPHQ